MKIRFKTAWAVTVLTLALGIAGYLMLDGAAEIPVHWNASGEVDGTASPFMALLGIPLIQIVIVGVFSTLRFIEPRRENLKKSSKAISATATATAVLLSLIELGLVLEAHGYHVVAGNYVLFVVGLFLAIMGNYLSKLRSGFFMGIRTPWTLSSDRVWQKTHRLGGRIFVIGGSAIAVVAVVFPAQAAFMIMMAIVLLMALVPILYSWREWHIEKGET